MNLFLVLGNNCSITV